jgi:DNA repair protein RecN (Recombination protein N)
VEVEARQIGELSRGQQQRVFLVRAIAQRLFQLGQGHQVLCVTHQPIVAAIADHHFQVSKKFITPENGIERTIVEVSLLEPQQRKQELAQLAGGVAVNTKKKSKEQVSAIAFAESLITQAEQLKSSPHKK